MKIHSNFVNTLDPLSCVLFYMYIPNSYHFISTNIQVFDVDSTSPLSNDILGLAVQNLSANIPGIWELLTDSTWTLVDASRCNAVLLFPDTRLRFRPFPNFAKVNGLATVMFR